MVVRCLQCNAELPGGAPHDLCPKCLLGSAIVEESRPGNPEPNSDTAEPLLAPGAQLRYFGDYELLKEIAHGGMGVVYCAHQLSLNRSVALKVILTGHLASPASIERFHIETEAAARLDHPNIVPIYEVGQHDRLPYFTMKLVDGPNLSNWIARSRAANRQWFRRCARLLEKVALAVHHAHQSGILHRDLKPANILVDTDDEPFVTDFGLAKLAEKDGGVTQSRAVMGTPGYMAPEQAAGRVRHLTTATDVYSLGAILYEMLTGRPPFQGNTGLETLRMVVEQEPEPPAKVVPEVDSDLETICLKCLQKEPSRRYRSAEELAMDLARWLADEPIGARPATPAERLWRWCRRKPALAGLSSALMIITLVGLVVVSAAWRTASRNEREARRQAVRSGQFETLFKKLVEGVSPGVAKGRDTALLKEIFDQAVPSVSSTLTNQPEIEADLLPTIAEVYRALGDYQTAEDLHSRALSLLTKLWGESNTNVAASMDQLAVVLMEQSKFAQAEPLCVKALELRRQLLGPENPAVAASLSNLGNLRLFQGKYAEAEQTGMQALAMRQRVCGSNALETAESLISVASALWRQYKDLDRAAAMNLEALAIRKHDLGDPHPDLGICLNNLATVYLFQNKDEEAETTLQQAVDLWRRMLGPDSAPEAQVLNNMGYLQFSRMKLNPAEELSRRSLAIRERVFKAPHDKIAESLNTLGCILQRLNKLEESEQCHRRALDMLIQIHTEKHGDVIGTLNNLAWTLGSGTNLAKAEELTRQALNLHKELIGVTNREVFQMELNLGDLCFRQGKLVQSVEAHRNAVEACKVAFGNRDPGLAAAQSMLAWVLIEAGEFHAAKEAANTALSIYQTNGIEGWRVHNARATVGRSLIAMGDFEAGEPLLRGACLDMERTAGTAPPGHKKYHAAAIRDLARRYEQHGDSENAREWRQKLKVASNQPDAHHLDTN